MSCSNNQQIAQPDHQPDRTYYVNVLQFRFFSQLRHFFFFDGATWSQLDLFRWRKVLLNGSLLLRTCDLWLEGVLGRFFQLSWELLVTMSRCVQTCCRSDVQLASLHRPCLPKDQTCRNGNMCSCFLSLHSNQACPPKKMDGSVMDGRTRSMCIMLQDVFGRNRL